MSPHLLTGADREPVKRCRTCAMPSPTPHREFASVARDTWLQRTETELEDHGEY